jgi:hypothetical protein
MTRTKSQEPNYKNQINSKIQIPNCNTSLEFEA